MRYRKTEVLALCEILEADHDDVEDLAKAIIDKLHDMRWMQRPWIAIHRKARTEWQREAGHPDFDAWGPYPGYASALRDVDGSSARFRLRSGDDPLKYVFLAQVTNPDAWFHRFSEEEQWTE